MTKTKQQIQDEIAELQKQLERIEREEIYTLGMNLLSEDIKHSNTVERKVNE